MATKRRRLYDHTHPQAGANNPNWKGGRTVASNGYVLVLKPEHPDADVRGYIYEHRLVAEEKLGRRLRKGEQVHHAGENGDKKDNRPGSIEVKRSAWEHHAAHRKAGSRLRNPGERNPVVCCACGCRTKFRRFDGAGRPRRYVSGHNNHG